MQRFIIQIEGPGFDDMDEIELPRPPTEGDLVDTKYGSCLVTATEPFLESQQFDGKIACKLP